MPAPKMTPPDAPKAPEQDNQSDTQSTTKAPAGPVRGSKGEFQPATYPVRGDMLRTDH